MLVNHSPKKNSDVDKPNSARVNRKGFYLFGVEDFKPVKSHHVSVFLLDSYLEEGLF